LADKKGSHQINSIKSDSSGALPHVALLSHKIPNQPTSSCSKEEEATNLCM